MTNAHVVPAPDWPGARRRPPPDYLLEAFAGLLAGGGLLWGVGILEGLPPRGRGEGRALSRADSGGASDVSEHTDWMSEMSKSEASLPLRLLPRLPALLPGRLGVALGSTTCDLALVTAADMRAPSSPDWNPFPER